MEIRKPLAARDSSRDRWMRAAKEATWAEISRSDFGYSPKTWKWFSEEIGGFKKWQHVFFFLLIPHVQSPAFSKRKRTCVHKHRLRTLLRNLRSTFKSQWKKHHPTFLQIFLLYIWKEPPWIWMTHMKSPLRFCCLWVCRPPWHFSHLGVVLFGMPRCSESTTVGCPTKNRLVGWLPWGWGECCSSTTSMELRLVFKSTAVGLET